MEPLSALEKKAQSLSRPSGSGSPEDPVWAPSVALTSHGSVLCAQKSPAWDVSEGLSHSAACVGLVPVQINGPRLPA